MAIDAVQAIHTSAAAQNVAAVDSAQRNPNPQTQGSALPQDKVTISPEAQDKHASTTGARDHNGDKK